MMFKLMRSLVLSLVVAAVMVPAAFAQATTGTGTLSANGDGLARLAGAGTVTVSGAGVLFIRDRGGDAVISVDGTGTRRAGETWARYAGFNGSATVSGSDVVVWLSGSNISLSAEGTGVVYLRGSGSYTLAGDSGEWTETGQRYSLK